MERKKEGERKRDGDRTSDGERASNQVGSPKHAQPKIVQ